MRSYRSSILWNGIYWATTFAQTSSNVSGDLSLSICDVRGATNIREQHSRGADAILESTEVCRGEVLWRFRRRKGRAHAPSFLTGWMRLRAGGRKGSNMPSWRRERPVVTWGRWFINNSRTLKHEFSLTKAGCSSDGFFLLPLSWCFWMGSKFNRWAWIVIFIAWFWCSFVKKQN